MKKLVNLSILILAGFIVCLLFISGNRLWFYRLPGSSIGLAVAMDIDEQSDNKPIKSGTISFSGKKERFQDSAGYHGSTSVVYHNCSDGHIIGINQDQ